MIDFLLTVLFLVLLGLRFGLELVLEILQTCLQILRTWREIKHATKR